MADDISTTVTIIFAIISLIAGAVGAFIYFRVSLENRLTRIETILSEGRLEGHETRLNERVKDIFGRRPPHERFGQ
jgi:hypothetical protein